MPSVIFALLHSDQKRVLMEYRPLDDSYFPGEWVYPGGKVDPDDTGLTGALLREVKEELGVHPLVVVRLLGSEQLYHRQRSPSHEVHPFLVTSWEGELPEAVLDTGHRLSWRMLQVTQADSESAREEITRRIQAYLQVRS